MQNTQLLIDMKLNQRKIKLATKLSYRKRIQNKYKHKTNQFVLHISYMGENLIQMN